MQLSTNPGSAPRGRGLPPRLAGQVRRLRRGVGRAAGQGGYSGRWRRARALRARPPGEGAAHKRRVCADAPPSARPPAARGWGRETPPGPPPARTPPPRLTAGRPQTPRLAGTRGRLAQPSTGGVQQLALGSRSAHAVRPGRARGSAGESGGAPKVGNLGDKTLHFADWGSLSRNRLCLQLSSLSNGEAGSPAGEGLGHCPLLPRSAR